MEYLTLKNTDLRVSRLCMGGCPMGEYGWGSVQHQDLVDAVHAALDAGINFFDTADTYGLGQSETTLGRALGENRDKAVIATKFGVRAGNGRTFYDNSPAWIRSAVEGSLRRLGTDYIDLYQLHYRDGITPMGEVVQTLEDLRREGKVRYFGICNIHAKDLSDLESYKGSFVSVQDEYSLACRKNEEDLLLLCSRLDMNPMTWGSLGQGILTGKYDASATFGADDRRSRKEYVNFHGEKLAKNLQIVEAMRPIAARYGVDLGAVAIRFILDYLPDSVVLAGAKRPAQILGNAKAMDFRLTEEELSILNHISL